MKQHNALTLLVLLCASQVIHIHANSSNTTKVGAKAAQEGPEDGYPEQPYEQQTDEGSGPDEDDSDEPKCPDPHPADSVKDGKPSCPPLSHAPSSLLGELYCCHRPIPVPPGRHIEFLLVCTASFIDYE